MVSPNLHANPRSVPSSVMHHVKLEQSGHTAKRTIRFEEIDVGSRISRRTDGTPGQSSTSLMGRMLGNNGSVTRPFIRRKHLGIDSSINHNGSRDAEER